MDVELTLLGPDHLDELKSLEDWLLDAPELAGCSVDRPAAAPGSGQMGAISDVLVVALGSGGMGAVLASSLSVWLRTRVSDLTVRVRTRHGVTELKAHNVQHPEAFIAAVKSLVPGNGPEPA